MAPETATPRLVNLDLTPLPCQPALDKDGNTIAVYLYHNGGNNYELRQYQIGSDGKFVPNGTDYHYTVIEATCDMKDTSKSYNLIGGNFV